MEDIQLPSVQKLFTRFGALLKLHYETLQSSYDEKSTMVTELKDENDFIKKFFIPFVISGALVAKAGPSAIVGFFKIPDGRIIIGIRTIASDLQPDSMTNKTSFYVTNKRVKVLVQDLRETGRIFSIGYKMKKDRIIIAWSIYSI